MFTYHATLDRLIGPVSMAVKLDLGFRLDLVVPVRLDGVALPEDRRATQRRTQEWFDKHETFVVQTIQGRRQTFDRWFAKVMDEGGECLNEVLLESGMVGPFQSGTAAEDG